MRNIIIFAAILLILNETPRAWSIDFENGDFAKGKFRWEGEGQIAYLKTDGTIDPPDGSDDNSADAVNVSGTPDRTCIMSFKLNSINFKHIAQTFNTPEGTTSLPTTIIFKASDDFKRNEKSPNYSNSIVWHADMLVHSYQAVFPKVDFFVRLDRPGFGSQYRTEDLQAGGDWKTSSFTFPAVGENMEVIINIFAPPGQGNLYVKSIKFGQ